MVANGSEGKVLSISERCLLAPDLSLQMLTDRYGPNRGLRLFGALTAFQTGDRQAMADLLGVKRNAVNRLLCDLKRAGLSLTQTDQEEPLPPLRVDIPDPLPNLPAQICTQVPGVTPGSLGEPDPDGQPQDAEEGGPDRDDH